MSNKVQEYAEANGQDILSALRMSSGGERNEWDTHLIAWAEAQLTLPQAVAEAAERVRNEHDELNPHEISILMLSELYGLYAAIDKLNTNQPPSSQQK